MKMKATLMSPPLDNALHRVAHKANDGWHHAFQQALNQFVMLIIHKMPNNHKMLLIVACNTLARMFMCPLNPLVERFERKVASFFQWWRIKSQDSPQPSHPQAKKIAIIPHQSSIYHHLSKVDKLRAKMTRDQHLWIGYLPLTAAEPPWSPLNINLSIHPSLIHDYSDWWRVMFEWQSQQEGKRAGRARRENCFTGRIIFTCTCHDVILGGPFGWAKLWYFSLCPSWMTDVVRCVMVVMNGKRSTSARISD